MQLVLLIIALISGEGFMPRTHHRSDTHPLIESQSKGGPGKAVYIKKLREDDPSQADADLEILRSGVLQV